MRYCMCWGTLFFILLACSVEIQAAVYYIDSRSGSDQNTGTAPEFAWKTIERSSKAQIKPGDRILLARGGLWREILRPHSGEEGRAVCYGAYGSGPKPKLYGSIDASDPEYWTETKPGIWTTKKIAPNPIGPFMRTLKNSFRADSSLSSFGQAEHKTNTVNDRRSDNTINQFGQHTQFDLPRLSWKMYKERSVDADFTETVNGFRVQYRKGKNGSNSIQIWGSVGDPIFSDGLLITFRAKCSKKFNLTGISMMLAEKPYTALYYDAGPFETDQNWRKFSVFLSRRNFLGPIIADQLRYHFSLGALPDNSVFEFELIDLQSAVIDSSRLLRADVGNIIFDHGTFCPRSADLFFDSITEPAIKKEKINTSATSSESKNKIHANSDESEKKYFRCGIKKWSLNDLKRSGQYWYDPVSKQVHLRWNGNPAKECRSIELALRETIVNEAGCHDIVFEDLSVAYGAAHGFGGGETKRLTIRNCDIYYIGGGHQHTRENGMPVRFGNGIEFWGNCDGNLVENNRLWEIYDAALTNQGYGYPGQSGSYQKNLIYRNNTVWNCEYSFEYWNRGDNAVSENIRFENNICRNAGFGWGHDQRPDPIGCHCMFSSNTAPSRNIFVQNNVFDRATECLICFRGSTTKPWHEFLTLNANQYKRYNAPLLYWFSKKIYEINDLPPR